MGADARGRTGRGSWKRARVSKSVNELPVKQDGPPPGGFPSIRYARRVPSTGPAGATVFGVALMVMGYGLYKVGQGNRERRALKEEKKAARMAVVPALQAEEDRRYLEVEAKRREEEAKLMKDVPGWRVGQGVYETGRWMPPAQRPGPIGSYM